MSPHLYKLPKCLAGYTSDDLIIIEIIGLVSHLHKVAKSVFFCWVTSHRVFPGNEAAYAAAKEDTAW
jgi:hypothetical protein